MASNHRSSVNSTSSSSPEVGRGLFQAAWKAFKASFSTQTANPATQALDGIYVEVFDDMETAVVDSKMEGNKEHVEQKTVAKMEKKIYNLNFLLELGKKEPKAPLPLNFSNDAIKRTYLPSSHTSLKLYPSTRRISRISVTFTRSRCFHPSRLPLPFSLQLLHVAFCRKESCVVNPSFLCYPCCNWCLYRVLTAYRA